MAGFNRDLLDGGRHETSAYSARNEETIVAESWCGSSEKRGYKTVFRRAKT
jgi:hypothetical protein